MRGLLAALAMWGMAAAGQQAPTPTREYVYLGGRLVAVESIAPVAVTVDCNAAVALGSGETRTCTATVTGSTNTSVTLLR